MSQLVAELAAEKVFSAEYNAAEIFISLPTTFFFVQKKVAARYRSE
jgi:hypothetical protein